MLLGTVMPSVLVFRFGVLDVTSCYMYFGINIDTRLQQIVLSFPG